MTAWWHPLGLSFAVATMATALSVVLGVAVAALLAHRRFVGRELLDAALSLPLVLPPTVLGYYLLVLLGRQSALGRAFEALTGTPLTFTKAGAVVAAMVHALPAIAKSTRAALHEVDPLLLRAAASLGAGKLRTLWAVSLPLCRRQILSTTMLAFARALGDFGVTLMVAGDIPGETQTAALAIYDAVQAGRERDAIYQIAILSVISLIVLYVVNKLSAGAVRRQGGE